MTRLGRHRDYYAGALMALLGAGATVEGSTYGIGTLTDMGSGFFPVALGIGLILTGLIMAAVPRPVPADHGSSAPDWRGAIAITTAVALFIGLARPSGLAPATFACVFAGALGARSTTVKQAAILALGITVFGTLLFSFTLKVPLPMFASVWP